MARQPDHPPLTPPTRAAAGLPRAEVAVLAGFAVFATVSFLPVTHRLTVAGVSVIAWLIWALMLAAPFAGLVIALRGKED